MDGDLALVRRIQEGDLKAFEALYERYKGPIYRTALAITRSQEAAEEILQECFVRAYIHIGKVDDRAPFKAWLHRIAVNLSYDWLSKQRQWWRALKEMVEPRMVAAATSPEDVAEHGELRQLVRDALNELDVKHRMVLILFYLHGFSLQDIAYILECPVGTVKSRLHYGREQLRRRLEADAQLAAGLALKFA